MLEELRNKIIEANKAYRLGESIITDSEYDSLIDKLSELNPDDELLNKVGLEVQDESRKRKLNLEMASMNKVKTFDEILDWIRLKGIKSDVSVVCTPKYDGLSLLVNEAESTATTRGDGQYGQNSDEHYKLMGNHLKDNSLVDYTWGEIMMSKSTFLNKYSEEFANPRNLVAGLINSKTPSESISDLSYIKYGANPKSDNFKLKSELLNYLNENQDIKVPFVVNNINKLNDEYLIDLFHKWSTEYEIDGIIIEIDDLNLQKEMGRETSSGNPTWARAYKHESFVESGETEVLGIEWTISKNGLLKPVAILKPIKLDGVTVGRCTLNNAKFVKDMGIGVGSIVKIIRSGFVIPKVIDVIKSVEFTLPNIGVEIGWNDAGIELITLVETPEQKFKKIVAFFEILGAESLGEGIIQILWNFGFNTIDKILKLEVGDLEGLEGFGKRRSKIIIDSIKKSVTDVQLSKLQHATGFFVGLGSKKLVLLEGFKEKPTVEEIIKIEGFAETSAKAYIDGWDNFYNFIKDLPITISQKVEVVKSSNELDGMVFVFTGVRDKDAEEIILSKSGKIGSGVSKTTTHLVCKDPNSGSSKLEKAKSLGVKIISLEELKVIING